MTTNDANEQAQADLKAEKAKLGIPEKGKSARPSEDDIDEEDLDRGDLDDEDAPEDKSKEEEPPKKLPRSADKKEDKEEEDDSEDDDEEDDGEPDDRKKIPKSYLDKEKAKRKKMKEKILALEAELETSKATNAELEAQLPDDLDAYADELAKEIGVEDPENLKKILKVMKKVVGKDKDKESAELREKITGLEEKIAAIPKVAEKGTEAIEFTEEWGSFEPNFTAEFPNATKEQIASAKKLMEKLSHTPGIGGKQFKDASGNDMLDPYPLSYIFFQHRKEFEETVDVKRKKGMETGKSQGTSKEDDAPKKLPKNASASQIRERERELARIESGESDLRTPENREL